MQGVGWECGHLYRTACTQAAVVHGACSDEVFLRCSLQRTSQVVAGFTVLNGCHAVSQSIITVQVAGDVKQPSAAEFCFLSRVHNQVLAGGCAMHARSDTLLCKPKGCPSWPMCQEWSELQL